MRILKNALSGILWGYLAGVGYAALMMCEYTAVSSIHATAREYTSAFIAMMAVGSFFIIPVGLVLGVIIPLLARNIVLALLTGATVALFSGYSYSIFYKAPYREAWQSGLQFAIYVFLWALWYTARSRRRIVRVSADAA
jgi:hypothetical protein